ncbi:MAG TPA: prolyl oligopeptidase family serine peptidase [Pyrinomonadaceae bacterium]|nr:prolyl oligopeptidase family serine peptidase [Pyrinomonadaceae bacterium]
MWLSQSRRIVVSFVIVWAFGLSALAPQLRAQTPNAGFTVDDLLDVANISVADLSDDGKWLAATSGTLRDRIGIDNHRFGDPTYIAPSAVDVLVIDTQTGKAQKLFPSKRQVRGMQWSPDASRLAFLMVKGDAFEPVIWERASGRLVNLKLPAGKEVADNAELEWSPDGGQLLLTLRADAWRKQTAERFKYETAGPVVVHSSKEPFLAWDDVRRLSAIRSLATYDVKTGQTRELLPETRLGSYNLTEDGSFLTYAEDITKKTDYDVIGGTENQINLTTAAGADKRTIIKSTKGISLQWSRDFRHYAYAKDGNIFIAAIDDKEPRQLTGKKSDSDKVKTESADKPKDDAAKDDKDKKEKERFSVVRMSPKGNRLVVSNKEGLWLMDGTTGASEMIVKTSEEDKESPRYQLIDWSPAGDKIYFTYASRTRWERGLVSYDVNAKKLNDVFKDAKLYSGFRLAKDGRTFVYSSSEGNRPADLYAADAEFKNIRRLTDANPQLKGKRLSKTELVGYLDADGNKEYGVLYYPVDYEPGKKYPTVFNIYEQFFDDSYNGTINVLTSNGYAVMQPSVNLEIGFPGEAWVKGVTAAANKLIEMGVADPERLGVQGTSYGGYATNLLITQTNRFKAAINISGKVDMVSFYTDSPRLGVRNIHAPEKSQDRLGATLWQQPQKYIQHSAIMFADRIKTPLLLMNGDQDHNVPPRQLMEMYYALRRLDKEVEWVVYTNGGHGMPTTTVAEVQDYHQRIIDWYDSHLKGDLKKKGEEQKSDSASR